MLRTTIELARPLLFALDPENAHELTLRSLEAGIYPRARKLDDPRLSVKLWDCEFPNPIGIAAGFDKDARVPDAILRIGFGFAEVGSVTPRPQVGNPRPRVFRLISERAIINRLGFNSAGHEVVLKRLQQRARVGVVGVNLGANKESADRTADYVLGIERFYDVASYLAVNISSPNTPGLRDLQAPAALDDLLSRVMAAREHRSSSSGRRVPIIVKIAPDIAEQDLPAVIERLLKHNVDGIAVSNTTLTRPGLVNTPIAQQAGGLSGRPLFHRSTVMLARVYQLTGGRIPLIGVGGIDSPEAALAKIEAGATLIQLYTGLVYEGPGLIEKIKEHLVSAVACANAPSYTALVGRRADEWARKSLDG